MSEIVKIAVDAMGGDNSPKKVIDGIIHNHKNNRGNFYKIFGDKNKIISLLKDEIDNQYYEIIHTENFVLSTDSPLEAAKKGKNTSMWLAIESVKKKESDIVISAGPAGTGKTFLAVAVALTMLLDKKIDRIILSRPAVEAGERLGFLPGDMREKVDPYLRPLYDSLYDLLDFEKIQKKIEVGDIEIAPLAFMRGRTLKNSFAILDEAQNATDTQIKMFLTRIGENSKIVVNGDPSQIDLINKSQSGLIKTKKILNKVKEIKLIEFDHRDVVRHPLVTKIIQAFNKNIDDKV